MFCEHFTLFLHLLSGFEVCAAADSHVNSGYLFIIIIIYYLLKSTD